VYGGFAAPGRIYQLLKDRRSASSCLGWLNRKKSSGSPCIQVITVPVFSYERGDKSFSGKVKTVFNWDLASWSDATICHGWNGSASEVE
jgi:hypothetical protein